MLSAVGERVCSTFHRSFGAAEIVVRSPGRINVIGEHTDYNDGFALPGATAGGVWLAVRKNVCGRARVVSLDLARSFEGPLERSELQDRRWPYYLLGVVAALRRAVGGCSGFDLVYGSDLPPGAGLSSSVALACGLIAALNELDNLRLTRRRMARIAQFAERVYVGTRCGVLDPATILFGERDALLLLDCGDLSYRAIPVTSSLRFVLCDSQVERRWVEHHYNERRRQCELGVEAVRREHPTVRSLRHVDASLLAAYRGEMGETAFARCLFVIEENARVVQTAAAFERGDLSAVGALLYAGHRGLRERYEASCLELDVLVENAYAAPGIVGARMMGAGFGGCTINVMHADAVDAFVQAMRGAFARLHRPPHIYVLTLGNGLQIVG